MSRNEELLGRNSSLSGLESREYGRRNLSSWPHGALYPKQIGPFFADKRRTVGRCRPFASSGHGVQFSLVSARVSRRHATCLSHYVLTAESGVKPSSICNVSPANKISNYISRLNTTQMEIVAVPWPRSQGGRSQSTLRGRTVASSSSSSIFGHKTKKLAALMASDRRKSAEVTQFQLNSVDWLQERTTPTERPPIVGEVSANFCG
jgi:hypothetical protein